MNEDKIMNGDRARTLLKAAYDLLLMQECSSDILNLLEQTVYYDNTDCDGYCLMTDIEAELTWQPPAPGLWQPIVTAPKDGRELLLLSPKHGVVIGSWDQVDGGGHPENGPPVYWWTSPHVEFIDGPYDAPVFWADVIPPRSSPTKEAGHE